MFSHVQPIGDGQVFQNISNKESFIMGIKNGSNKDKVMTMYGANANKHPTQQHQRSVSTLNQ